MSVIQLAYIPRADPPGCIPVNGLRNVCYQHFSLFGLGRANPGPKFTKIADDLLPTQVYHPARFHHPASTHARDICYKKFADILRKKKRRNGKQYISPTCVSACGVNNNNNNSIVIYNSVFLYSNFAVINFYVFCAYKNT